MNSDGQEHWICVATYYVSATIPLSKGHDYSSGGIGRSWIWPLQTEVETIKAKSHQSGLPSP
jgi:hypothetical protein